MIKRKRLLRKKIKTRFIIISLLISFLLAFQTISVCADDFNNNFPEMNSIRTLNNFQLLNKNFNKFPDSFKQTKIYNDFQNNFDRLKIDFPDYNFDLKLSETNRIDINNIMAYRDMTFTMTAMDLLTSIVASANPITSAGLDLYHISELIIGASNVQDLVEFSPIGYEFEFIKPLWNADIHEIPAVLNEYNKAFNVPTGADYQPWLDEQMGWNTNKPIDSNDDFDNDLTNSLTENDFSSDWNTWEHFSYTDYFKPITSQFQSVSSINNNPGFNIFNTIDNYESPNNYGSSYLNDYTFNNLNSYNSWNAWDWNSWDTSWINPTWNNPTWNDPTINTPSWDDYP